MRAACHVAILSATWPLRESSNIFALVQFFDLIFGAVYGGLLVLKMGHAAYCWKSHEVYFPTI